MNIKEALSELFKLQKDSKFDQSIDLAINLNLNSKKPDQNLRHLFTLPNKVIKKKKILVIDNELTQQEINDLKIDYYGGVEMVEKITGGWLDFDIVLTTSAMMPKILKLGKILGPKNLMPNIKAGTITNNIKKTIKEFQDGKKEFKNDSFGNVHLSIGKISFGENKIIENFEYFMKLLTNIKPKSIKGKYIKTIHISSTMSKSFEIFI